MELVGITTLLTSFIITVASVILVKHLARILHFVDKPGDRKVHKEPIPLGGGVALFLGIFLTLFLVVILASVIKIAQPRWLPAIIYSYLPGIAGVIPRLAVIFIGGMLIFLIGLFDDIRGLKPSVKLLGQLIVAVYLVFFDVRLTLIVSGYEWIGSYIAPVITVLWIILITNSLNLLDHMDGLSAGVTAVLSAIFLIVAYQTGQYFIAGFLCAILGATLGFLVFNTHPASIFMGDAGSLLLGYLISVLTIIFTFYQSTSEHPQYVLFVPLVVVAVPLFDTIGVILIRIKRGQSIFKADMNHLAHRLINLGMSVRESVFTIYLLTLGTGLPAVLLYFIKKDYSLPSGLIVLFQVALLLIVITLLERAGRSSDSTKQNP